jgi:ADP-ribose pyrophosphatase YjhB (NUDIX family)
VVDRVYLVVLRDGRVLLEYSEYPATERSLADGRWWLPGGGLLPGESFADAAAREAREEIGCEVVLGPIIAVQETLFAESGRRDLRLTFLASLPPGAEPEVPERADGAPGDGRVTAHQWLDVATWEMCPPWIADAARGEWACHYVLERR